MSHKSSAPIEKPVAAHRDIARPHLFDLMLALIDARASRVDILDTRGAAELERYLQARHAARRSARSRRVSAHASTDTGSSSA